MKKIKSLSVVLLALGSFAFLNSCCALKCGGKGGKLGKAGCSATAACCGSAACAAKAGAAKKVCPVTGGSKPCCGSCR